MPAPNMFNHNPIKPGIYEILSGSTGLYLNCLEQPSYNNWYDDALTLEGLPTRRGKWEIAHAGRGFTIKNIFSGLFCAITEGVDFLNQPVVLSCVPTVWMIESPTSDSTDVRISWSVCDLSWEAMQMPAPAHIDNELQTGPATHVKVGIGKSSFGEDDSVPARSFIWQMKATSAPKPNTSDQLKPGLYSLENKRSKTYVMLAPNEETLGCWPKSEFTNQDTKLWEIAPLGDGYTIRLCGTNRYCTIHNNINGSAISLSTIPAAWKIVRAQSALHSGSAFYQIFWSETKWIWDLEGRGRDNPGTPIQLRQNNSYEECRLFQFLP